MDLQQGKCRNSIHVGYSKSTEKANSCGLNVNKPHRSLLFYSIILKQYLDLLG